jgi:hypothetical protein
VAPHTAKIHAPIAPGIRHRTKPLTFQVGKGVALSGGHDPDRATRKYEVLQNLDDAHGAQGVGDHHTYKFVGRNVGDRFTIIVLDARIDDQHVELSRCQMRSRPGHLIGVVHVDGLDFESIVGRSR